MQTIVSVGEDLTLAGLNAEQLAKVSVVYLGTHANATSELAKVVIPTTTVFEKSGTLVNQQFRIQKFAPAVPPTTGTTDGLVVLAKLIAATGGGTVATEVNALWSMIAAEVPALATMNYRTIPANGLLIDGTPYSSLPFVEGQTLHFAPATAAATTA